MTSAVFKINDELKGIELYFSAKPVQDVISNLKDNGFRWSGFKKCWYSKQSEKAFQVANSLACDTQKEQVITSTEKVTSVKTKGNTLELWESTRWTDLEVNRSRDTKEMAKEIRTHVRKRFPQCKFSVTSDRNSISFYILSAPYAKESEHLKAIKEYCNNLLNAYKYCTHYDPYGDYGSSYNFYGSVSIDWEYAQVEATEEQIKDMQVFDNHLAQHQKEEEDRKEKEYQEYKQQEEMRALEYKKRQQEEQKQTEYIYINIDVKTLDESEQYFVIGSEFANLNKNSTLDEYKEEVKSGKYSLENVKITKEVHFSNEEALSYFSNMLLHDFDFLSGTGGSYTDDNRINSMTDFYNMDKNEKQSVKWNLLGVAVYLNNKLQFVVDAKGHSYARYVGLTDNATIEKSCEYASSITDEELSELKHIAAQIEDISFAVISNLNIINKWQAENWNEYKIAMKSKLKEYSIKLTSGIIQQIDGEVLKANMYKLLQEVDSIQEQFKDANIQQGDKLTLFYVSGLGSVITSRVIFDSVTPTKYAQYDNAVKLVFTPENKRKLHYNHFYSTLLVYKGWHALSDTVLNHVEVKSGFTITSSKFLSCDHKQYDEVLKHFEQQGIKPIVNTHRPAF